MNFIDLKAQYEAYKDEIQVAINDVLDNTAFIGGPALKSLEEGLKVYTGAKNAIGCASGTDALFIALKALDIGPGDEVITSPFTFFASAGTISLCGAKPVFVDIEDDSYNINPELLKAAITPNTKAIMPVSLYGQPADMDAINHIAGEHSIPVIEDAAQSFGGEYKGKMSCNLSSIACTSFYPAKPLGAYGEGGAIFTSDDQLASKMRMIINQGQSAGYVHDYIGLNGRLDGIQAAVLNVKLKHFPAEVKKRQELAEKYDSLLQAIDVITPKVAKSSKSVYAQYSIRVKDRDSFRAALQEKNIPTAVHYPKPLYAQPVYKDLGIDPVDFPVAEIISKEIVSLPMSPFLKEEELEEVVDTIKNYLR